MPRQEVGAPFFLPPDGAEVGEGVDPRVEHRAPARGLEALVPGAQGGGSVVVAVADVLDGGGGSGSVRCRSFSSSFADSSAAAGAVAAFSFVAAVAASRCPSRPLRPLPHPRRRQPPALGVGGLTARLVGDVGVDAEVFPGGEAQSQDLRRRVWALVFGCHGGPVAVRCSCFSSLPFLGEVAGPVRN